MQLNINKQQTRFEGRTFTRRYEETFIRDELGIFSLVNKYTISQV